MYDNATEVCWTTSGTFQHRHSVCEAAINTKQTLLLLLQTSQVYDEITEEDRWSTSPAVEVYTVDKYTGPNKVQTTDEKSAATAPAACAQHQVNKSVVEFKKSVYLYLITHNKGL